MQKSHVTPWLFFTSLRQLPRQSDAFRTKFGMRCRFMRNLSGFHPAFDPVGIADPGQLTDRVEQHDHHRLVRNPRLHHQALAREGCTQLARIHQLATPEQRRHAVTTLGRYETELRQLATR